MTSVLRGAHYLVRGFALIAHPQFRRYVAVPLAINVLVFAGLIWAGVDWFGGLVDRFMPAGDAWWLGAARTVLWLVFAGAAASILYFSFTMVANLLGAPFNGFLAEAVETALVGAAAPAPFQWRALAAALIPAVVNELRKLRYYLAGSLPLLAAFLVPGLQLIAPIAWTVWVAWGLAVEYADYPMANHDLPFTAVRQRMRQNLGTSLGFGAAVMLAGLIPLLNLFVMPAAVAGATALWVERNREPRSVSRRID